ncbi:MAG: lipocalin family protein [Lentisphaeria bacterium]|nr:lipocalin family protein [Lentisphaeria bacterium]
MVCRGGVLGLLLGVSGCVGLPSGVRPVTGFEVERYLGTWYEIARLDHRFERGLDSVSATYRLRPDGRIDVLNRGRETRSGTWRDARGVASFLGDPGVGRLKVRFFWPFYGAYTIMALDENYTQALVCGPNRNYLWVLARTPTLDAETLDRLLAIARTHDFPTADLLFVRHGQDSPEDASGRETQGASGSP